MSDLLVIHVPSSLGYQMIYFLSAFFPSLFPATPSPAPCNSQELTKWDKLFSMLENSQMRENMLLQYADDIIKVEMGSLRGELLRLVGQGDQRPE